MNRQSGPTLTVIGPSRIIDGTGARPLANWAMVIQDGQIRDIKPWNNEWVTELGPEAEVIELDGATLLPGFVDSHVHLIINANYFSADRGSAPPPRRSDTALLLQAVGNAQSALRAGVTTLCDCGGPNHIVFALRQALKDGTIKGPSLIASGDVITTEGGHGAFLGKTAKGVKEVRQAVVQQVEAGADFIKVMVTGGGGDKAHQNQFDPAELGAIVDEARRWGLRVAAHCHGTAGIRDAVEAGVSRIEHCSFVEEGVPGFDAAVAKAIVQRGIYVCPTNTVDYRQMQRVGDAEKVKQMAPRAQLNVTWRKLLEAGVTFIAGSDAGVSQIFCDDYALILELMVWELGMSPMDAILAGTRVAAEAMGIDDEIGTLKAGKRADIVAVEGDPLLDISALRKVRLVMARGEVAYGPPGRWSC